MVVVRAAAAAVVSAAPDGRRQVYELGPTCEWLIPTVSMPGKSAAANLLPLPGNEPAAMR